MQAARYLYRRWNLLECTTLCITAENQLSARPGRNAGLQMQVVEPCSTAYAGSDRLRRYCTHGCLACFRARASLKSATSGAWAGALENLHSAAVMVAPVLVLSTFRAACWLPSLTSRTLAKPPCPSLEMTLNLFTAAGRVHGTQLRRPRVRTAVDQRTFARAQKG